MKNLLIGLTIAIVLFAGGARAAELSAHDILVGFDKVRNPGQPFRVTNTLTEYVKGQATSRTVLVVFARENTATSEYSNLVRYVEPVRDLGKMVLMNGSSMWFYDPSSKASVRVSAQQRLMGQASNGDVVTVNFSRDYTATLAGEESLLDADKQNRNTWHLDLKAATGQAVYSHVEYWIEKGTFYPVKGKFYSDSGRLLKIAYYHKLGTLMGKTRPVETIIIDAVDTSLVTTMYDSDMKPAAIPDSWFQRDFLPRLKID